MAVYPDPPVDSLVELQLQLCSEDGTQRTGRVRRHALGIAPGGMMYVL